MIKQHGNDAALSSASANKLLAEGGLDGQRAWQAIINAIEELLREKPVAGEKVH